MSRARVLTDEQAEALYQDYCCWLEARAKWHPKKLAAKYGINLRTVGDYAHRKHKRRAA